MNFPNSSNVPPITGQSGYGSNPVAARPATLSLMALSSFLVALISPVGVCFCYPTLFGSLVALVLGHVALFRIWRSGGQQWGSAWAIGGLLLAYPLFLLSAVWLLIPPVDPATAKAAPANPARSRLVAVEFKIATDSNGNAFGNTPEAIVLAEKYSARIKELRDELFTKSKSKFKLSGGNFVTHCELRDDRCIFVVHAPDLRHFEGDAKESLNNLAWAVAQETVRGELPDDCVLGVGIKGVIYYSAVMVGKVGSEDEPKTSKDGDDLVPLFKNEEDDALTTREATASDDLVPLDSSEDTGPIVDPSQP